MKNNLFAVGLIMGGLVLWLLWRWETRIVHFHAGFAVYENGARVDFAQPKYMNLNKCADDHEKVDEQLEKAHLHDNVGDVVHVHRRGAKWRDLFDNINYVFPAEERVGYVNGKRINNVLSYQIKPYDNLVIVVGRGGQVNVSGEVPVERMKEVEKITETCGK